MSIHIIMRCSFLTYWEKKYKHMWEADKEAYIRRYEKAQKTLAAYEADIQRYIQLQDEVQGEDSTTNMRFLRIDCGPLKQTLIGHCEQWVQKFTGLLNQLALTELKALHEYFKTRCDAVGGIAPLVCLNFNAFLCCPTNVPCIHPPYDPGMNAMILFAAPD